MNTIFEIVNSVGKAFIEFALPMLVQSCILILILLLTDFFLRKKVRAVFRYWIWMLVLIKLVLPTSLSSPLSIGYLFGDKLTSLPAPPSSSKHPDVSPIITTPIIGLTDIPQDLHTQPAPTVTSRPEPIPAQPIAPPLVPPAALSWQGIVFLLWLAVVIAMVLLLLQRAIFVNGLVAQAGEADSSMKDTFDFCREGMGIRKRIGLQVSANATSPAVCGLFRPMILLPQNLSSSLNAGQLQSVLFHELAHIKRGDLWVNLAQTILQILYFYNPLLWIANAIIRRIREQAVDETVLVAMGQNAKQYPQTLVDVAKLAFKRPALSLRLIGVVESKSALAGRIKRILTRPIPKTTKLGILSVLVIAIAAAVLLPMAKAARKAPLGISDILNISDASGQLTIKSISMPPPEGKGILKKNFAELSVEVENSSEQDLYLGLEYYEDAGMVALFSPGAVQRAYIRRVPKNWTGRLDFQIQYIRFVSGGNLQLKLAKCPPPESYYPQGNLVFLPVNGTEIIFEKKYVLVPKDKDKQTATQGGSSAQSKFVATLPNSVTVELVGVCEHPSEGRPWWRPDGQPLGEFPYKVSATYAKPPNNKILNVLMTISPGPAYSATKFEVSQSKPRGYWIGLESNRKLVTNWKAGSFEAPPTLEKADVKVGIAGGPWQKVAKISPRFEKPVAEKTSLGQIQWLKTVGENGSGDMTVYVASNFVDKADSHLIAVDITGEEHFPYSGKGEGIADKMTHEYKFHLRTNEVRELFFVVRPYQWVTFKNVSLQPGVKTDVQVEVEGEGERSERDWGKAVEGIQMRIRPERLTWYEGESPRFLVDMRNQGTLELELVLATENWEFELDGLWYEVRGGFSGYIQRMPFGPGQEHKYILISPEESQGWYSKDRILKSTPGQHTFRVALRTQIKDPANWRRLRAVSNAVVIEVLPVDSKERKTDVQVEVEEGKSSSEPKGTEATVGESLKQPGRIRGVVVDSVTGKPVAGAYVGVGDFGDSGGSNYERHRAQGFFAKSKTDPNGRFELDGLAYTDDHPEYDLHPLVVTHPDFVRHDEKIKLLKGWSIPDVKIALRPAAKINVTIVDSNGAPLEGFWLFRLEAMDGRRFIPPGQDPHLSAFASSIWIVRPSPTRDKLFTTGFSFTELDSGEYSIEVIQCLPPELLRIDPEKRKSLLANLPLTDSQRRLLQMDHPEVTYHGGISNLKVEAGQTKEVQIKPADYQTSVTIKMPQDPVKKPQIPPFVVISRNVGLLAWHDGKAHGPEDHRLGRMEKNALYCNAVVDGDIFKIKNLPPGSYSVFAGPVYFMSATKMEVAGGRDVIVDIPPIELSEHAKVGLWTFNRRVKPQDREYSVSELCEFLTAQTNSNPSIIADPSIEKETVKLGKKEMSIWDLFEKIYLDNGWKLEEAKEAKTMILRPDGKPARQPQF